jgi:hypothetical protein
MLQCLEERVEAGLTMPHLQQHFSLPLLHPPDHLLGLVVFILQRAVLGLCSSVKCSINFTGIISIVEQTSTNLSLGQDRLIGSDFLLDTGQGSLVLSDVTAGLGFLVSAVGLQFRQLEEDKMDK